MWKSLWPWLFPLRCAGCGRPPDALCAECTAGLRPPPPAVPPAGLDWWVAAFAYDGAGREVVARVKYRGTRGALPWISRAVAAAVRYDGPGTDGIHVVTWPPTTTGRIRARGFDPAAVLARLVARELDLPAAPLLQRVGGPAQTGRTRRERHAGPSFACPDVLAGLGVLLVDDVATTGATLAAAAGTLRLAGAEAVMAATAGRTPDRTMHSDRVRPSQAVIPLSRKLGTRRCSVSDHR